MITVERWARRVDWRPPELTALLEHLWAWLRVSQDTFDEWVVNEPLLLDFGLTGSLPESLLDGLTRRGVDEPELRAILEGLVELVYDNLYGAPKDEESSSELDRVLRTCARRGVEPPALRHFADHCWVARMFGRFPDETELTFWRELARSDTTS
ncbi:MAG: hypothetical protein AAF533_13125 [Acidobacteriota bacterium]